LGVALSVRGPEGLELVGAPTLPDLPGFRVLGVAPVKGGESAGMRKFTATLVPTQAGRLEIPAISMSSFDPESGRYQSTATSPLSLEVAAAAAPTSEAEPGLRPQHGDPSPRPVDLLNSRIFWGVQAIPLLFLGAAWLAARPPRPPRPARVERGGDFLSVVQATLSQKLGQSVAGLSSAELSTLLTSRGVSASLAERLTERLSQAQQARYSRAGEPARFGQGEAQSLLRELERNLR